MSEDLSPGAAVEVIIHRDKGLLANAVAARLLTSLIDAQAARGEASVVLTGGGIGNETLRAVRDAAARDAVDWRKVDVYWGDERFVAHDDDERNEVQAREALLDALDLDPARVFAIDPSDGPDGGDLGAAADRYARTLAAQAPPGAAVPAFDVLMLGVGPEGHIASLFPDSAAVRDERQVVAEHNCPKPPPTRISLTLRSITAAREVWLIAAGEEKAEPLAQAAAGATPVQIPAAGARGRERSLWLLDRSAASRLPAG